MWAAPSMTQDMYFGRKRRNPAATRALEKLFEEQQTGAGSSRAVAASLTLLQNPSGEERRASGRVHATKALYRGLRVDEDLERMKLRLGEPS